MHGQCYHLSGCIFVELSTFKMSETQLKLVTEHFRLVLVRIHCMSEDLAAEMLRWLNLNLDGHLKNMK